MCNQHRQSSIGTRVPPFSRLFAIVLVALLAPAASPADQPTSPPSQPVLHLANGGYVAGEIRASSQPGVLRWQAASFVKPFDFALSEVNAIQWPPSVAQPIPSGDFCFELAAGDVLFGSLRALDEKQAELVVPRLGHIHVQRSNLHRVYRWRDGADLIYLGPNGLVGWQEPAGQKNWREDSGQPMTDREGASIRGDFGLPDRASIEFEISWRSKPDFVFALGVDDKENTVKRAFRFEAWGGDLVVQRELEQEADLAVVQEVAPGPGRTHLQAYLDQEKGRILVFSPGGKQLADLKVAGTRPAALPGLYLANIRGDVRLEWLRIGRWNGEIPREVRTDQTRIHRADGSIIYGQLTGLNAASKEFVLKTEKGESRVPENQVSSVFLSVPKDEATRMIRAVYQDGSRVSGELAKVEDGVLAVTVPGIQEPLRLPLAGLRSLVVLRHENPELRIPSAARLEMVGTYLTGRLVDGREGADASCLTWHPVGSSTPSPLRPGTSGKIVYREPPPPRPRQPVQRPPGPRGAGGFALRFAQALAESPSPESTSERRSLFLRSGDVIPSVITGINEEGVMFQTVDVQQHVRPARQGQGCGAGARVHHGHRPAEQDQARAIAHGPPDAEGQPAHSPDPLQERRLPARAGRADGPEAAPGRDPAGEQGPAPRPDLADHLAPCRRARPVEEAGTRVEGDPNAGRPQRRRPYHVLARTGCGRHGLGQERRARSLPRPHRRGGPVPLR